MYKVSDSIKEKRIKEQKSNKRFLIFIAVLVAVLCLAFFMLSEVFFNVVVEGASMEPTVHSGDVLTVNSFKKPKNGDIVIIKKTVGNGEKLLIKRAIAVSGDRVKIEDGYVVLNGKKLEEEYLSEQGCTDNINWEGERILAEDEVFYLGDNRENSSDSRIYGVCKLDDILGVVEDWSFNPNGVLRFFHNIFSATDTTDG